MGLMKNTKIYLYIVVAAMALAGCAKRDDSLASRKNAMGANYINGQQAQNADAAAAASGYTTDITSIQAPVSTNGGVSVTSVIAVNNKSYQVVTTHYQINQVSTTTANFDGATFEISGICSNTNCSPYYLIVSIKRNNQPIKQTAMKKYFFYDPANPASAQDLIMSLGPTEFMPIQSIVSTLDNAAVTQ